MAQQERRGLRRMIIPLEDLCDVGEIITREEIQALYAYYMSPTLPDDLCGNLTLPDDLCTDAILVAVAVNEQKRKEGR